MSYKILTKFLKDVSFEIPNAETFLTVANEITKYKLKVDIVSKPLKNKIIQVDTILKLENNSEENKKIARIEIIYSALVRLENKLEDKEKLKKIIVVDVPTEIYPDLIGIFEGLIVKSGLPKLNFSKKIDFAELYKKNWNTKKNFFLV